MSPTPHLLPVVLQHGAGQDGEIWADVAPRLRRPVHVHESPGHGGRFGRLLATVEELADDLVAHTPESADAHGSVLVGHGLGGVIALQAALDHPEGVRGVVVVATGPRPPGTRFAEEDDLTALVHELRAGLSDLDGVPEPLHERSVERLVRIWHRTGAGAVTADHRAAAVARLVDRLRPLEVPTAVIGGGADRLVPPQQAHELADALGVPAQILPGVSHLVPWEDPGSVAITVERVRTATRPVVPTSG